MKYNLHSEKNTVRCQVTLEEKEIGCLVTVEPDLGFGLEPISFMGDNYFSALNKVRLALENIGFILGCNGCRRDFYPSRMSLQMSQGKVGYELVQGQSATKKLRTFDEYNEYSNLVKVSEQELNYNEWLESL